jgi:hypothetical protein
VTDEELKLSVPFAEKYPLIGVAWATETALRAKAERRARRFIIG